MLKRFGCIINCSQSISNAQIAVQCMRQSFCAGWGLRFTAFTRYVENGAHNEMEIGVLTLSNCPPTARWLVMGK